MMKTIFKIILVVILLAVGLTTAMQAFTCIYKFSDVRTFSGDSIVNPYQAIDSTQWKKGNFHAHQRWMLFGMDFEYTAPEFIKTYRDHKYDIVGIADHQQINENGQIPTYEHGIGLNNYHLLMMGATDVSWFDYPIMLLPVHQMQYQLDKFKPTVKLLGMNHPSRHRHRSADVFVNLMGYDLMEMNPDLNSTDWDIALSSGVHSNLISNDDAHSIDDRGRWFQRSFTMVNSPSLSQEDIIASLKDGRAYGVVITIDQNNKKDPHNNLPSVLDISLVHDSIRIAYSAIADSIRFIGQDTKTVKIEYGTDSVFCKFGQSDTYIRTEAFFADGTQIWTNPFYRIGGSVRDQAKVDTILTVLNSSVWSIITLIILWLILLVLRPARKKDYDNYYR